MLVMEILITAYPNCTKDLCKHAGSSTHRYPFECPGKYSFDLPRDEASRLTVQQTAEKPSHGTQDLRTFCAIKDRNSSFLHSMAEHSVTARQLPGWCNESYKVL